MSDETQTRPDAVASTAPGSPPARLDRRLGVTGIVLLVVAAVAPLGVVAGTFPVIFAASGSPALPLYMALATTVLLLFSVGFTRMSKRVKNAGAFYAYIRAGLGRIPGVGAATLAITSYVFVLVGANVYLGVFAAAVTDDLTGVETTWWPWSLATLLIVAVLGYRDIEVSARVLGVLLALEILVILVVDGAVVLRGGAEGLTSEPLLPNALTSGSSGIGIMFAFFAFFGFEATAVFREEAKDPDRTIPRATYLAVILVGSFYLLTSWAVVIGVGVDEVVATSQQSPESVVPGLAAVYVSKVCSDILQILVVTSTLAAVLSFHNVIARYQYSLARTGLLPRRMGDVHPRHRAPSFSSVVLSVVCVVFTVGLLLSGLDPVTETYAWLVGAATLGLLTLMSLTSLSVIVYFRRNPDPAGGLWRTVVAPFLAFAGMAYVMYLAVANFDLLVGSAPAATVLKVVMVLSLVVGCATAAILRFRSPARYALLAGDDVADDEARMTVERAHPDSKE